MKQISKPIRFMSLMGLAMLVWACSQDPVQEPQEPEKPEVKETPIAFTGSMQQEEEVTRASTSPLSEITTTFKVWGYKNYDYEAPNYTSYQLVMSNYTVNWVNNTANTTASNTHDWEYVGQGTDQTIKYWDFSAKAYRFFGYVPGVRTPAVYEGNPPHIVTPAIEAAEVTATGDQLSEVPTSTQVTLTATIDGSSENTRKATPYFSELWYSTGKLPDYAGKEFGKAVQLRFMQPFARVRLIFIAADNLTDFNRSRLDDIGFHPSDGSYVPTKGRVTVSYPLKGTATAETWSTLATEGVRSLNIDWYEEPNPAVEPDDAAPTTYPNSPEHWNYVFPALSQGSYTVEVSVDGRQVQTATVPANYMSWKPGYEYTYVFKITQQGEVTFSKIQVAVSDWNNATANHAVFNW